MASNFNRDNYKKIFEQRFGSGSYESGLAKAREIGRLKGQADMARKELTTRRKKQKDLNSPENAWANEVVNSFKKEQQNKEFQKQSDSSLRNPEAKEGQGSAGESYWASKGVPVGHGTSKPYQSSAPKDNSYKNPYSRDDLLDALKILRKNEDEVALDSFARKFNSLSSAGKDVGDGIGAYDKTVKYTEKYWDKPYKPKNAVRDINGNVQSKGYDKTIEERKLDFQLDPVINKKHEAWLASQEKDKPKKPGFLSDVGAAGKAAFQFFNPFDDVSMKEAAENFMNRKPTDQFNEVARGANRAVDSASLGVMSNLDKKLNDRDPYYNSQRKFGEGGGTDMVTSALGYLVPGVGAYKALNATKAGKGLTQFGSQGLKQRLASEAAKGSIAGGAMSGAEVGVREGLNPDDYNWKQNAGLVGLGVAGGAIADPLLYGAGKAVGKGFEKAAGKAMRDIMPSDEDAAITIANMIKQSREDLIGLPAPKPEPLGLLAPQPKLPAPKPLVPNVNRPAPRLNNPIPQIPDVMRQPLAKARLESQGLGFGMGSRYEPKASSRMMFPESTQNQSYWQNRYEDFAKQVNSSYDMNRMTPEALEDLWTQFARYDEPVTLDQAIDLAYPKGFEPVTPKQAGPKQMAEPAVEPEPVRTIKDDLAADPRINQLTKGLFPPQKPISRVATRDEVIKMMEETVAAQKKPEDILKPLQFSREKYMVKNPANKEVAAAAERIKPGKDYERISSAKAKKITDPQDSHGYGLIDLTAGPKNDIPAASNKAMQKIKDITPFQVGTKNLYELADRLPKSQGAYLKKSLDTAKKNMVADTEKVTSDLMEKVVKGLGIKKGSKESALVQDFGEKTLAKKYLEKRGIDASELSKEELNRINLQELKKLHPGSWQKIVAADNYFRQKYNARIDEVNAVRSKIYPGQSGRLVPKREDYYHHFNELEGMEGIRNLFDTPANIDPHLEGISTHTKPKTKFQGFMQKRGVGPYKSDAVGGYLRYAQASSHSIHVDPVIPVVRGIKDQVADATANTKNANKIVEALEDHAKDLAGKTNDYDRLAQKMLGRKGFKIMNWANSRVKSNMILGNLGSALGQVGSVPLGIGKAKLSAVPGLSYTLQQATKAIFRGEKNAPVYKSDFLKERFSDKMYRQFDQRLIDQPKNMAVWMLETADKAGTKFIWNSMYHKGLKQKVKNPIKYADYETRKIVAGRGVGEIPLLQKSKTMQVFAPFTLEVGNQWKVLHEMVGEKDAKGILTFLIASYGLNRAVEEVRGMGVSFDPIDALIDGYTQGEGGTGKKSLNALASLNGEVVGNIPGGNLLTQFANTDKEVPLTDIKFKELFGERDPNRFGTGLTVAKPLSDPLYLLPFGAAQIRKTQKGIDAVRNDGVYKDGDGKELMYPVDSNIVKDAQMLMFGPSSTSEAKEYYNNERRPLSERQTNEYKAGGQQYYDNLMYERRTKNIQTKIKDIEKDKTMSEQEKRNEILYLMRELQKLQK